MNFSGTHPTGFPPVWRIVSALLLAPQGNNGRFRKKDIDRAGTLYAFSPTYRRLVGEELSTHRFGADQALIPMYAGLLVEKGLEPVELVVEFLGGLTGPEKVRLEISMFLIELRGKVV